MIAELIEQIAVLEKNWSLQNFPQTALSLLREFDNKASQKEFEREVGDWLLAQKKLPNQVNLYNVFGEPPVTLFNNGTYALDIYFWRKNDTLIHSHAFRGAFKLLYGRSLHEEFQVKTTETVDDDILLSQLSDSTLKIMKPGDDQVIEPGLGLVHRVVHLDDPTITLCLRTVNDVELNQWHHLPTGLSYQKRNLSESTVKQILYFQYAFYSDAAAAERFLSKFLEPMDISAQLSLYESVFFNELGLDYEASCVVLDAIKSRHENSLWFKKYEDHYRETAEHLLEHHASSAERKLLAHAINCHYPIGRLRELLAELSDESLEKICGQLLLEEAIFSDEFKAQQFDKIEQYLKFDTGIL